MASQFVDTDADFVTALYTTTEQETQQDAELVEGFATAVDRSLDHAAEHADEVRAQLPDVTRSTRRSSTRRC